MSYIRWSSTYDGELSNWYIFWCSMRGDESNKRKDQHLAMWLAGYDNTPVLDYNTVKTMLETDDWSPLGFEEITQKNILVDCVNRWITQVENECG